MSFNKNKNDDIIDAEFVVDGSQKKSVPQNENLDHNMNQFIRQYQFQAKQNSTQQNFSAKSFSWNLNNKKGTSFKKPNFLVLLVLSPIILVLLLLAAVVFLLVFILFMPKIIRLFKHKGQLLRNLSNLRQKQN